MKRVEFESAHPDRSRYRLSPREGYVLRLAPIYGRRKRGWALWMVGDENLSKVVEGLLRRGFLALRGQAGLPCAELTAEGRAAIAAHRTGEP